MNQVKDFLDYIFNLFKFWIIIQPWEQGIRVRFGKKIKIMNGGVYFRLPWIDSVFVQSTRLRIVSMPMQNLTSKDFKSVTALGVVGYSISNIELFYSKLFHPDSTIINIACSELADYIYANNLIDISPQLIEVKVLEKLKSNTYGIEIEYFKLTGFAVVRTIRLIQDNSNFWEGISMNEKK